MSDDERKQRLDDLKRQGWWVGTVESFLGLTAEERKEVERRVDLERKTTCPTTRED